MTMRFPKDFLWGAATASYQVEGGASEDGRGESIWDHFSKTPGKVLNGATGDVACDHFHRYPEDMALMASLNLQAYRFSIAWPRIQATGSGPINQKGLDFYRRLLDELRKHGIAPAVTLYHWDLPQALQERGGWTNRDTAERFAEYAAAVIQALGSDVPHWITHNEPWCASFLGYGFGIHAPGLKEIPAAVRASHHLLLSHGLAVDAFRALAPKGAQIGITLNLAPAYPAGDSEADRLAAGRMDGFQNRWFLDPVFHGRYPADMLRLYETMMPMDHIRPGDLEIASRPIDFLGVNYYSRARVEAAPAAENPLGFRHAKPTAPLTDMGWEVTPDGLTDLLLRLKQDYGDVPLYITENGAAYPDRLSDSGEVDDPDRVAFLQAHFAAALRAVNEGVHLKGFYVWSLMDNFEWSWGYTKRFGIIYVDYASQRRIPKASALWYRDFIARQGAQAASTGA